MCPKIRHLLLPTIFLISLSARAVLFQPLPISALASEAEIVIEGKVLSKTSLRDESGRIYTRIELEVAEVWKGSISGSPFHIVQGGGIVGEERSSVSGQVEYKIGENVVAFLARNARGEGVTLGLAQGRFHVWKDANTGAKFAVSPFHGLTETVAQRTGLLNHGGGSGANVGLLRVSDLKRIVREAGR
jgi:hypothetical protein